MRLALLLILTVACSTGSKHDDASPMPPSPPKQATADAGPYTGPKVFVSSAKGDVQVNVEVVQTEAKIEKGLMFRRHLPLDAGMLFLMGAERDWTFWMRNTLIPLDMIFIRKDMTVAGIVQNAEPQTDTLRKVGEPSLYVLEVNAGYTRSHGVVKDAKVRFENLPR